MSIVRPILVCLVALLVLSACGNGGRKARYELEQLSEEQAIDQLISKDNAADRSFVFDRINDSQPAGYDWKKFWRIAKLRDLHNLISPAEMARLLDYHNLDCSTESWRYFARYILHIEEHYVYLMGEKRKCESGLGPKITRRVLRHMMQGKGPRPEQSRPEHRNSRAGAGHGPQYDLFGTTGPEGNYDLDLTTDMPQEVRDSFPMDEAQFLLSEIRRDMDGKWGLILWCELQPGDWNLLTWDLQQESGNVEFLDHLVRLRSAARQANPDCAGRKPLF